MAAVTNEPASAWASASFYQQAIDTLNTLVAIGSVAAASTVTEMLAAAGLAAARDAV